MKSTPPDQQFAIVITRSERTTPTTFITDRSLWQDRYRYECSIQAKFRSQYKGKTSITVIKYNGIGNLNNKRHSKHIRSITIINSIKNATR